MPVSVVLSALSFPSNDREFHNGSSPTTGLKHSSCAMARFLSRPECSKTVWHGTRTPSQQSCPSINEVISLCSLSVQCTSVNTGGSVSKCVDGSNSGVDPTIKLRSAQKLGSWLPFQVDPGAICYYPAGSSDAMTHSVRLLKAQQVRQTKPYKDVEHLPRLWL